MAQGWSGAGQQCIVPYDERWPSRAGQLMVRLRALLGDSAVAIEHIGSTAVPGLASRPIPDIQVSVPDIHDDATFRRVLEAAGYRQLVVPELDVDDYLVFVPADGSNTEHIEVCQHGSFQEHRHVVVRDYLRAAAEERAAYEQVKRRAADAAAGERARYSAGKDAFVRELERRALAWSTGFSGRIDVCDRAGASIRR